MLSVQSVACWGGAAAAVGSGAPATLGKATRPRPQLLLRLFYQVEIRYCRLPSMTIAHPAFTDPDIPRVRYDYGNCVVVLPANLAGITGDGATGHQSRIERCLAWPPGQGSPAVAA